MLQRHAPTLLIFFILAAGNVTAQDAGLCRVQCDGVSVSVENRLPTPFTVSSVALFWSGSDGYWSQDLKDVTLPAEGKTRIGYGDIVEDFDAVKDAGYPRTIVLMLENTHGEVSAQAFIGDEFEGYSYAPVLTGSLQMDREKIIPQGQR
jgi:hypothetical protein